MLMPKQIKLQAIVLKAHSYLKIKKTKFFFQNLEGVVYPIALLLLAIKFFGEFKTYIPLHPYDESFILSLVRYNKSVFELLHASPLYREWYFLIGKIFENYDNRYYFNLIFTSVLLALAGYFLLRKLLVNYLVSFLMGAVLIFWGCNALVSIREPHVQTLIWSFFLIGILGRGVDPLRAFQWMSIIAFFSTYLRQDALILSAFFYSIATGYIFIREKNRLFELVRWYFIGAAFTSFLLLFSPFTFDRVWWPFIEHNVQYMDVFKIGNLPRGLSHSDAVGLIFDGARSWRDLDWHFLPLLLELAGSKFFYFLTGMPQMMIGHISIWNPFSRLSEVVSAIEFSVIAFSGVAIARVKRNQSKAGMVKLNISKSDRTILLFFMLGLFIKAWIMSSIFFPGMDRHNLDFYFFFLIFFVAAFNSNGPKLSKSFVWGVVALTLIFSPKIREIDPLDPKNQGDHASPYSLTGRRYFIDYKSFIEIQELIDPIEKEINNGANSIMANTSHVAYLKPQLRPTYIDIFFESQQKNPDHLIRKIEQNNPDILVLDKRLGHEEILLQDYTKIRIPFLEDHYEVKFENKVAKIYAKKRIN